MQEVGTKVFEREFPECDALFLVLQIEHFVLQPEQLLVTPFEIGFRRILRVGEDIVLTRRRKIDQRHARFYPTLQVDVVVEIGRRPEIDHLDAVVQAADAVDTSETLDQANRIPVNVEIDQ